MKRKLIATEKWTQGKPIIPAYLSVYIALNSHNAYKIKLTKRTTDFLDARLSNPAQWHSYYDHFHMFFADAITGNNGFLHQLKIPLPAESIQEFDDLLRNDVPKVKEQLKKLEPKEFFQAFVQFKVFAIEFIRGFLLNGFEFDSEEKAEPVRKLILDNQAMAFLFCVLMPCMLEFQAVPHELYDEALKGNFEALEVLVRIDKHIITHPKIQPVWTHLASDPTSYPFRTIAEALNSKPGLKNSTRNTKATHAAIIELMFQYCHKHDLTDYKLSRTQLFELFDCISSDLEGMPNDYEFADTPEARDRMVNREIKRITSLLESLGINKQAS